MNTFIALIRGINVGGKNALPMKELAAVLEGMGAIDIRTYLQSGNAVFRIAEEDADRLSERLTEEIRSRKGFGPRVMILGTDQLEEAVGRNPFPEAEAEPSRLHLGFLASVPTNPDLEGLGRLRAGSERFELIGSVFYLDAPDGVGRSKLAARSEKLLGEPMTDRNWRTVSALSDLARSIG